MQEVSQLGIKPLRFMQYNVAQLLKEPTGSTRSYQLDETFTGPRRMADRATGFIKLLKTHQGIIASGRVEVLVTFNCSRCVAEFHRSSRLFVEEEFIPLVDLQADEWLTPTADLEMSRIDENNILDLTDVLRQDLITDQPMKPLCQQDCLGLCQFCGVNLNQQECRCGDSEVDPRWSGLEALLSPRQN